MLRTKEEALQLLGNEHQGRRGRGPARKKIGTEGKKKVRGEKEGGQREDDGAPSEREEMAENMALNERKKRGPARGRSLRRKSLRSAGKRQRKKKGKRNVPGGINQKGPESKTKISKCRVGEKGGLEAAAGAGSAPKDKERVWQHQRRAREKGRRETCPETFQGRERNTEGEERQTRHPGNVTISRKIPPN